MLDFLSLASAKLATRTGGADGVGPRERSPSRGSTGSTIVGCSNPIGNIPTAEAEDQYYATANIIDMAARITSRPLISPARFSDSGAGFFCRRFLGTRSSGEGLPINAVADLGVVVRRST